MGFPDRRAGNLDQAARYYAEALDLYFGAGNLLIPLRALMGSQPSRLRWEATNEPCG
jgi:hypothetical protein